MPARTRPRRRARWIVLAIVVVLLVPVALIVVPILTHDNQGESHQEASSIEWPLTATATGDDGRTRSFTVSAADGKMLDTALLEPGTRIVVTGSGYDASQGIYVAICKIPADATTKPGPCVGGVPEQGTQEVDEGTVQYAPSNWINDDWAWKLFGSRSYDDVDAGTFTAYIEVGEPEAEGLDCTVDRCGIYTRNDHTALNDRVQDLYIPVGFTTR
jgi:hypothetical protein